MLPAPVSFLFPPLPSDLQASLCPLPRFYPLSQVLPFAPPGLPRLWKGLMLRLPFNFSRNADWGPLALTLLFANNSADKFSLEVVRIPLAATIDELGTDFSFFIIPPAWKVSQAGAIILWQTAYICGEIMGDRYLDACLLRNNPTPLLCPLLSLSSSELCFWFCGSLTSHFSLFGLLFLHCRMTTQRTTLLVGTQPSQEQTWPMSLLSI